MFKTFYPLRNPESWNLSKKKGDVRPEFNMDIPIQPSRLFPAGSLRDLSIISLIWTLAIILVNPMGDFPLNDDWSYGIAVKRFLEEGGYYPTVWTSMSLISQVLWGSLFAGVFGFSFEVLRFSTLVLGLFGLWSIYLMVRHLQQASWLGILFALAVAFNPIYFALSYTFMTDVPFMAFVSMALLFLLRNLQFAKKADLWLGTLMVTLAVLCRQNALFMPIAFAVVILFAQGLHKQSLFRAFVPLIISLTVLLTFQNWLEARDQTPALYGKQIEDLLQILGTPSAWFLRIGEHSIITLFYLGLFLFPLLLVLAYVHKEAIKPWLIKAILPLSILGSLVLAYVDRLMPIKKNVLNSSGIGPLTLHDTYLMNLPNVPALPTWFWFIITMLSLLGVGILLWYLFHFIRSLALVMVRKMEMVNNQIASIFFLLCAIIYFGPLAFLGFFDRYLVLLQILLAFALLSYCTRIKLSKPRVMAFMLAIIIPLALFSIAATHDYLSWNRARWDALQSLEVEHNVPFTHINGGFEYNGYSLFDDDALVGDQSDNWWEEEDDLYMISFGEVQGYDVVRTYPYKNWLPPYQGKVYILRSTADLSMETE